MNTPEPEDLDRIRRSHFREVARRKLPSIRDMLAAKIADKTDNTSKEEDV